MVSKEAHQGQANIHERRLGWEVTSPIMSELGWDIEKPDQGPAQMH